MPDDPYMTRLTEAIDLLQSGDRGAAKQSLEVLWAEIKSDPDPLHQCILSHYLADAQDNPTEALQWDLSALAAAGRITPERIEAHDSALSVAGFYPSLHLNVADNYLKLGDSISARRHMDASHASLDALPDSGYAAMIRGGFVRLAKRLDDFELGCNTPRSEES